MRALLALSILVSSASVISAACVGSPTPKLCTVTWGQVFTTQCHDINRATSFDDFKGLTPDSCLPTIASDGDSCQAALAQVQCSFLCPKCGGGSSLTRACPVLCDNVRSACPNSLAAGCVNLFLNKCEPRGVGCTNVAIDASQLVSFSAPPPPPPPSPPSDGSPVSTPSPSRQAQSTTTSNPTPDDDDSSSNDNNHDDDDDSSSDRDRSSSTERDDSSSTEKDDSSNSDRESSSNSSNYEKCRKKCEKKFPRPKRDRTQRHACKQAC